MEFPRRKGKLEIMLDHLSPGLIQMKLASDDISLQPALAKPELRLRQARVVLIWKLASPSANPPLCGPTLGI